MLNVERRWHACWKTLKTRPHTRGACLCQHSREKLAKLIAIDCVHMTSRRPCWRSKQTNGGHVGGVKYSFGDKTLFLCKSLLLFHYANMASGHMSEHTVHNSTWCKVQNSLFCAIYIINYGLNKNRKEKIKKNRVLHIIEKKERCEVTIVANAFDLQKIYEEKINKWQFIKL